MRSRGRSRYRCGPLVVLITVAVATLSTVSAHGSGTASATTSAGDNVILRWNAALLDAIKVAKSGPPMVARAVGVLHTCTYDAWAAYDPVAVGTRLGGTLRRPAAERTVANKSEAISYAAYLAATDLYPASKPVFEALMTRLGYDPTKRPAGNGTPAGIGIRACRAVLDYRHGDGSNQLGVLYPDPYSDYTGYAPRNEPMQLYGYNPVTVHDPDRYQPLIHPDPEGGKVTDGFLGAQWGSVRLLQIQSLPAATQPVEQRLILEELRRTTSPGPARYGSARYVQQTKDLMAITSNLTERQKVIAEYWSDGPGTTTPAGHWMRLTDVVSRRDHNSLDEDVKLFFAMGNSQADAAVASWYVKRYYDSVRPITSARYLFGGQQVTGWGGPNQGTVIMDGSQWRPYQHETFPTPPFPEYVSGHSAFSFSAAAVLTAFTGSDRFGYSMTIPQGSMTFEHNLPSTDITLTWPTFSYAAAQVGMSRRYGGIHFEDGDIHGRALGTAVGQLTWTLAQRYFHGTACSSCVPPPNTNVLLRSG